MIQLYKLNTNSFSIGRSSTNDVFIDTNELLSSKHLVINVDKNSDEVIMYGKNGGYISDQFIEKDDRVLLKYLSEIKLPGVTILWLHEYFAIGTSDECNIQIKDSSLVENLEDIPYYDKQNDESKNDYTPSPKAYLTIENDSVELEAPPEKREEVPQGMLLTIGPAFSMAIPMLLGFLITYIASKSRGGTSKTYMLTGLITAVTSSLMGAVWASLNLKNRSREIILSEEKRRVTYESYVNKSEALIKEKYYKNRNTLRAINPSLKERFLKRNWNVFIYNKNNSVNDSLPVRLGTGNMDFNIEIKIPKEKYSLVSDDLKKLPEKLKRKYSYFTDVPICINLFENQIVGLICTDKIKLTETINSLLLAAASAMNPQSLKIALMLSKDMSFLYSYELLMLPHFHTEYGNLIAIDKKNFNNIYTNINKDTNKILVITDCYEEVRSSIDNILDNEKKESTETRRTRDLFTENNIKNQNICYIVIADSFFKLPDNVSSIIQRESQFNGLIDLNAHNKKRQEIYFDYISEEQFNDGIRLLSMLSSGIKNQKEEIPKQVGFLKLNKISNINNLDINYMWSANSTLEEIKIPIGISECNEVVYLDFHEKGMGPHGLIAGMTGSGKSEVLQTIILSLAMKYHPNEVGFVLIDYKGGGMASLFEGLPHILGSISNLSGSLTKRAMISIKSENERRQQKFIEAGVNNISEYLRLFNEKCVKEPLPHIFIVIDEFAELKREEPDFLKELISVARVGRSLGIHLILATQKPSGTVDDNILSNSRYRICLKVADKQDSNEMIGKPLAQDITNPGRGYLQVGNDEVFIEFQCAYTMAPYIQNNVKEKSITFLNSYGREVELSDYLLKEGKSSELKEVLNRIIKEHNKNVFYDCDTGIYENINDRTLVRKIWLDPLPNIISYDDIFLIKDKTTNCNNVPHHMQICLGIYDDPRRQIQNVFILDIIKNGHIFIQGFIASGKSSFLTLVSYALVKRYDPKKVNLYICDFSSPKLLPFRNSTICGGYFNDDNENELDKLFNMLSEILVERKRKLNGVTYRNYIENVEDIPVIILIIDGLGNFRERTGGVYDNYLINMLKMGESLGVFLYISALAISSQELPGRMFEYFKTTIPFNLQDKYKYSETLRLSSEKIPEVEDYPGRGVIKIDNEAYAFQAYLPSKLDDFDLRDFLENEIKKENERYVKNHIKPALRVPVIPDDMRLRNLLEMCKNQEMFEKEYLLKTPVKIPVGYEEKSGKIYAVPLAEGVTVVIAGGRKKGKTNLLKVMGKVAEYLGFSLEENDNYLFEHIVIICDNNKYLIAVYDEEYDLRQIDNFKEIVTSSFYLIHLGGNLDRCSLTDFSYISYSKQCINKKAGQGIALYEANQNDTVDILIVKDSDFDDIN